MAYTDYGVLFNGRRIVHPGAYANIDASAMGTNSTGSYNIPIVVGTSDAGEPGVVKWFSRTDEATNYLKGGDLLSAINIMMSPSPEGGGGASIVGTLIVSNNTKAISNIGGLQVESKEYSQYANRIQTSLSDGTFAGTKKFTVYRWDVDKTEVFNNLGAMFDIKYTGSQAIS